MNRPKNPECFVTSDLALAAFLVMTGHELIGIDTVAHGKFAWQFMDFPRRETEVLRFLNRKTAVEPNAFLDHIKGLKGALNR